jgi:hypothetical protein
LPIDIICDWNEGESMIPEELKEYLDEAIRSWRRRKNKADSDQDVLIARCYIDAFQSVRVSVFGSTLPQ